MKHNSRVKAQLVFFMIAFLCCISVTWGASISRFSRCAWATVHPNISRVVLEPTSTTRCTSVICRANFSKRGKEGKTLSLALLDNKVKAKQTHKNQDGILEDRLWDYVNKAKREKGIGIAAAYCLHLLYAIDSNSLKHKDLSGTDLQGGNLSGLDLSRCNLTDVNLSGQNLTQVKLPEDLSKSNLTGANLSGQNLTQVKLPKDLSKSNLIGAQLPKDVSGMNLKGVNFTGYTFTHTNLTDTNLDNVTLTDTTCDYQKAFLDNIKKNSCHGGNWYQTSLPQDLKSIAAVYPKLNNDTHKAKLLHIACGLSRLPFYESTEFYIKVAYWSCELLQIKQTLGNPYRKQLICSLQSNLEYDVKNYCWTTKYPQDKVSMDAKPPHANFAQYLNDFKGGLTKYQCKSKYGWGFNWYKKHIIKNIKGLKKTYPKIKEQQLQQEACDIAHALSKSYQNQKSTLLFDYVFLQHRLIRLKKSIGVENEIHYKQANAYFFSWHSMT